MGLPVLSPISKTDLGNKIVQSAAFFEASVAAVLNSEAEKLQFILASGRIALGVGDLINTLTRVNDQIRDFTCCAKDLEDAIVEKIAAGREIGKF